MVFNQDSFIVKLYVKKIKANEMTIEQVPELYNLKEIVATLI